MESVSTQVLKNHINNYLNINKISFREFAKVCEIPNSTLQSICDRGVEKSGVDNIIKLCQVLNISIDDLLYNKSTQQPLSPDENYLLNIYRQLNINSKQIVSRVAEMEANHIKSNKEGDRKQKVLLMSSADFEQKYAPKNEIPVYNQAAAAGYGNYLLDDNSFEMVPMGNIPQGAEFGIRISGDSMQPKINDKDIVFVHRQPAIDINEIGIFILNGEQYCKQLKYTKGRYCLHSINPKYKDIYWNDEFDSIYCCGKVIL